MTVLRRGHVNLEGLRSCTLSLTSLSGQRRTLMGGWFIMHEGSGRGLESVRRVQTRVGGYRQLIRIMG